MSVFGLTLAIYHTERRENIVKIIEIKGTIVSDAHKEVYVDMGIEHTAPKDVLDKINLNAAEPIEIHISSGGGDAYTGFYLYSKLKDYKGKKTVKVLNIAASAASVIAMAGDEILISPVGQIMIHNASTHIAGNQHEMRQMAETLEELAESLVNAYELRTGQPREQLQKWMDEENYFSAHKAVQYGFADEVMYSGSRVQSKVLAACVDSTGLLNDAIIAEYFAKKNTSPEDVPALKKNIKWLGTF